MEKKIEDHQPEENNIVSNSVSNSSLPQNTKQNASSAEVSDYNALNVLSS